MDDKTLPGLPGAGLYMQAIRALLEDLSASQADAIDPRERYILQSI
ncbi:MAG: hypothetical protein H6Q38_1365 [Chloroflexi bacterium]|nr:hypothetical protein [Chloroflexota bacterium]